MRLIEKTLMDALEALGDDWAEHHLPQDVLLLSKNLEVLLGVRELLRDQGSDVTLEMLQSHAPTFVEQHRAATLQDISAFQ